MAITRRFMQKERINISPNQEAELVDEVGGFCPLCRKSLWLHKGNRTSKGYQIAHIYPHSPTHEQLIVLRNIPHPADSESMDNLIPLCLDCHKKQDDHTSVEDYINLYNRKKHYQGLHQARIIANESSLEPEVRKVLEALHAVDSADLVELTYSPVKVNEKVTDGLLQRKIVSNVVQYYNFVKQELQELDAAKGGKFELIASQVHQHFLRVAQTDLFQEHVFDQIVEWLQSKVNGDRSACEIVVSFFVQNCEVFNAIAK